jgi:beta-lactamase class A
MSGFSAIIAAMLTLFTTLLLVAAQGAPASKLDQRIARLTAGFQGKVFIYAKNLDTGAEFSSHGDERVRTASTIKLPILCALSANIASGRLTWQDRVPLRDADKVSGSGVLTELSAGTTLSLRELSNLMIVVSDNTATNLVLDRLTADAVNDYLDTIGLRATRSNRKVRGDGTDLKAPEGWSKAGRMEENARFGLGVSTPHEMVRLLEMLERGAVVNAQVSKDIVATLKRQQDKSGIGRHAGDLAVASKSGSLDHLRSDVGIVYTKRGPVAMAITVDDVPATDYSPDNPGSALIWRIADTLMKGLTGGE